MNNADAVFFFTVGTKTGGNHGTTNKLYIYIIIGIVVGILAVVAVIVILYCGRGRKN